MQATYAIYTSPSHKPVADHLPTLIVCPHGKPSHILCPSSPFLPRLMLRC